MKKAILSVVSFACVALSASGFATHAAGHRNARRVVEAQSREQSARPSATPVTTGASRKLSAEEERLVEGSRESIVAAGIRGAYFDSHFTLFKVVNAQGDRRVVWRFRINGYEAFVNDAVGYYTNERGQRVDTHSVAGTLSGAHEITDTITPARAERILRACIGPHSGGAVVFQSAGAPARAALVLTAASIPKPARRGEREREERERHEQASKSKKKTGEPQLDVVEGEEGEGDEPTIYIGSVDLETGRCTKGLAIADHPKPKR